MLVKVCMSLGHKCFKCMFEMLSIHLADEFLSCLIIVLVSAAVASSAVQLETCSLVCKYFCPLWVLGADLFWSNDLLAYWIDFSLWVFHRL